jgi:preprotein translocase subunit SecY
MLKTIRDAFKVKEIRNGIIFDLIILVVVRLGCLVPTPGVNTAELQNFFANKLGNANTLLDSFTGGSFQQMSIFALSVTPYITSSIIIQLLTIAIPALEEMQKDGADGRK